MPLYTPPPDIVRELRHFDPLLRLRWSDCQRCWRLERRVTRGSMWGPSTHRDTPDGYESWVAARDGYILVDLIHPQDLSPRLIHVLRQSDIWAHGGADAICAALDRLDADERMRARTAIGDLFEQAARERWRYMNTVRTIPERAAHSAPPGGMSIVAGSQV